MFEKLVKNKEDLNSVAAHLRNIQNFDELRLLAEEWLVPHEDVEDFISGKRYRLAETKIEEKTFTTAEEKLREEMWILRDKEFSDIVAQHLIKMCEDASFAAQVLLSHKTLQKCLNYVMEKAYQIAEKKWKSQDGVLGQTEQKIALALSEIEIYKWSEEYYALDDADEEEKKKEEAKRELRTRREKAQQRKEQSVKNEKNRAQSVKETKKDEAQISLFDLMSGNSKDNKGEKNESV